MILLIAIIIPSVSNLTGQDLINSKDTLYRIVNAVKLNPLLIFNGEYMAYYERKLVKGVSIELGGGVTRRNYLNSILKSDIDIDVGQAKVTSGIDLKVALRYYLLEKEELGKLYISPEWATRTYYKSFPLKDSLGFAIPDEFIQDKRKHRDLKFIIGFQKLSYYDNFFFDLYTGVGMRNKELTEVRLVEDFVDISHYQIMREEEVIAFFIGLKLGLGF